MKAERITMKVTGPNGFEDRIVITAEPGDDGDGIGSVQNNYFWEQFGFEYEKTEEVEIEDDHAMYIYEREEDES